MLRRAILAAGIIPALLLASAPRSRAYPGAPWPRPADVRPPGASSSAPLAHRPIGPPAPRTSYPRNGGNDLWWDGYGLPVIDGLVKCAIFFDGDLIVGGEFTQAGGVPASNIARWDGSAWSALGSGTDEEVDALAVFGGCLVAGGAFTQAGGAVALAVARWDGSSWSAMGDGFDYGSSWWPRVLGLAVYRGDLIATGDFMRSGSVVVNAVARWDGTSWSALGTGLRGLGAAATVFRDSLYVGGSFCCAGSGPASNIARWDGATWAPLHYGVALSGGGGAVNALAVSQGRLCVGGQFNVAGTTPASNIAAWNGSDWDSLGNGADYEVTCLADRQDTLVAGRFVGSSGLLEWDGSAWHGKAPMEYGYALTLLPVGSDVIVGGGFEADSLPVGGVVGFNLARWTGTSWTGFETWNSRMHGLTSLFGDYPYIQSLAAYRGELVAAGFLKYAGDPPHRIDVGPITSWDGTRWRALMPGKELDGQTYALLAVGDTLYAAGSGHSYGPYGLASTPVFRFDGSAWSAMDTLSATATSLVEYQGSLYAGARRSGWPSAYRGGVYQWSGGRWQGIGSTDTMPGIQAMTVSNGKLVAAGWFDKIGGVPAKNVAAWDGQSWQPLGSGLDGVSWGVTGLADWNGLLVSSGDFVDSYGQRSGVQTWDGTGWSGLGSTDGVGYTIANIGGRLFAGGWFGSTEWHHVQGLLEWDGSNWVQPGSGLNGPVFALLQLGDALIAGGEFTQAGGKSSFGVARWNGLAPPPAPVPAAARLSPSRPNPFKAGALLTLDVPRAGIVRVAVYDVSGREIARLEEGYRASASYTIRWNGQDARGRDAGTGVYFMRAELPGGVSVSRKIVRIR